MNILIDHSLSPRMGSIVQNYCRNLTSFAHAKCCLWEVLDEFPGDLKVQRDCYVALAALYVLEHSRRQPDSAAALGAASVAAATGEGLGLSVSPGGGHA